MNNDYNRNKIDSVYSKTLRAGKRRTYFFDVRSTKNGEFYLTISESVRRSDTDTNWDRHKIFLYKEDFNRFATAINETLDHVKNELMPHYDYDEFTRRQEEYEQNLLTERTTQRHEQAPPRERENRFHFNNKNSEPSQDFNPGETKSAFDDDDLGL